MASGQRGRFVRIVRPIKVNYQNKVRPTPQGKQLTLLAPAACARPAAESRIWFRAWVSPTASALTAAARRASSWRLAVWLPNCLVILHMHLNRIGELNHLTQREIGVGLPQISQNFWDYYLRSPRAQPGEPPAGAWPSGCQSALSACTRTTSLSLLHGELAVEPSD